MAIYNLKYINEFLFKKKEIQKINYDSFTKQDLLKIQNVIKSIIPSELKSKIDEFVNWDDNIDTFGESPNELWIIRFKNNELNKDHDEIIDNLIQKADEKLKDIATFEMSNYEFLNAISRKKEAK